MVIAAGNILQVMVATPAALAEDAQRWDALVSQKYLKKISRNLKICTIIIIFGVFESYFTGSLSKM